MTRRMDSQDSGEPLNDNPRVSEASSEVPDAGVLLSRFTKGSGELDLNVHLHLEVRRLWPAERVKDEHVFCPETSEICAVLEGGSWRKVEDFPDRQRNLTDACDPHACRADNTAVQQPVLVSVREPLEYKERLESRGGLIRLQRLNDCHMAGVDEAQSPLLSWRSADLAIPVVWRIADRELVTRVNVPSRRHHQGANEMVERAADVMQEVTEHDSPLPLNLWDAFQEGGERIVNWVMLAPDSAGVAFNNSPNLGAQSVQMIFCPAQLEVNVIKHGH